MSPSTKLFGSFYSESPNPDSLKLNDLAYKNNTAALFKDFKIEDIKIGMAAGRALDFDGMLVSGAYRKSCLEVTNELGNIETRMIGYVNVLVKIATGYYAGWNTDWAAIVEYLKWFNSSIKGKQAIILGKGCLASSAAFAFGRIGTDFEISETKFNTQEEFAANFNKKNVLIFNATPVILNTPELQIINVSPETQTGEILSTFRAREQFKVLDQLVFKLSGGPIL